jgi:hypothetical protein
MVRLIVLVPLGVIAGACAAMIALLTLTTFVPDLGAAFVAAFLAAWRALWRAIVETDDPALVAQALGRAGALATLVLLAPIALTAVIAEIARLRGALAHAALAGALTILIPYVAVTPNAAGATPTPAEGRVLACLFFAGAASGLIYYAIAGRRREQAPPAVAR